MKRSSKNKEGKMEITDKKLEILDKDIKLDLTIDDLRRILMLFRFVKCHLEIDNESHFDLQYEVLMSWLEQKYNNCLKEEGITCF